MEIIIEKVTKYYQEFIAVKDVSLKLEKGKIYCLVGDSGSGKTTLMKIMSGLLYPTSGHVYYDGISIYETKGNYLAEHRNRNIGFVFQDFFLEEKLSVFENVSVPLLIRGQKNKNTLENAVQEALEAVDLLPKTRQIAGTLSGGEKQRAAIARAIVGKPKIIFADEPTGNLDSKNSNRIIELLKDLNKLGHTIFLVTHNQNIATTIPNKFQMIDGEVTVMSDV
ncbi:MAG: ABC transporter ATP-binding protein [Acholeplasmataceae bacterium]|nr:ABC transporter ATP-binding protein [Acholeplasmataceae bacterium]